MEERFDVMICLNCRKEMHKGVTVQGYNHPLIWSPGTKAITYGNAVKLSYSKNENQGEAKRFTSRFRTKPSYFPAWYCEACGLMMIDIKTELEKA